ncbi:hypothetical protein BDI4_240010 [Burkholderia diffusa]|nr:hypothetical protein BDI4_240010 [Burkholderia diffusa]
MVRRQSLHARRYSTRLRARLPRLPDARTRLARSPSEPRQAFREAVAAADVRRHAAAGLTDRRRRIGQTKEKRPTGRFSHGEPPGGWRSRHSIDA